MSVSDLAEWMDNFGRPGVVWCAKRLAANDTLATNAHQAGPYLPKDFLFRVLPSLNRPEEENPDVEIEVFIDSHSDHRHARAGIWYIKPSMARGRATRHASRGSAAGAQQCSIPENGALTVFAFVLDDTGEAKECHTRVCGEEGLEADLVEERLGPVEPKQFIIWAPGMLLAPSVVASPSTCRLTRAEILPQWMIKFPNGEEIIRRTLARRPAASVIRQADHPPARM